MFTKVLSEKKRIAVNWLFIIIAICLLIKLIFDIVLISRIFPWYFHGEGIAIIVAVTSISLCTTTFIALLLLIISLVFIYTDKLNPLKCLQKSFLIPFLICSIIGIITFSFGILKENKNHPDCSKAYIDCQKGSEKWINGSLKKQKDFDEWLKKFTLENVCHKLIIPIVIFSICQIILLITILIIVGSWKEQEKENVNDIQFAEIQ